MENPPAIVAAVLQLNTQVIAGQQDLINRLGNVGNVQGHIQQQLQEMTQNQANHQQNMQQLTQNQADHQQQMQALTQKLAELQQALIQGLAGLQNQMNANQNALLGILNQNAGPTIEERNRLFRIGNRSCLMSERLNPILAADGNVPPNFPLTKTDVASLTTAQLGALLESYDQEVADSKRARFEDLSTFIGY